jgi:hypothetical protein
LGEFKVSLKFGTREWNDRAERAEWSFVAKIMNETLLGKTLHPLSLVSAIKLARVRAKTGWRSVKDSETSYPDSQPHLVNNDLVLEIEILKKALRDIRDFDNVSEITGFSSVTLMGMIHLIGEISHNALRENQNEEVYAPVAINDQFDTELLKKIAIAARQVKP